MITRDIKMNKFTNEELKNRSNRRIASVLYGYWEEKRGAHTRLFDILMSDYLICIGESVNGKGHREHLVPCVYLRDHAYSMYNKGSSVEEVAIMLNRLLAIANISKDEAKLLDHELGLKTKMPEHWCQRTGSITARLDEAGIKIKNI